MWKYNLKSNCVVEQPTMIYPTINGAVGSELMLEKYHNQLSSLRSIPVSGKVEWADGEDVTDKFTVEEENFEKVVVPIVDFSKVVYLADACPEKNQPIEYETDRELEESLFNGVPEDIKNKIISESDWQTTNGHGWVDEAARENIIRSAIFGYLLSQPKEHKSDENSLPKSDIEQEAEKAANDYVKRQGSVDKPDIIKHDFLAGWEAKNQSLTVSNGVEAVPDYSKWNDNVKDISKKLSIGVEAIEFAEWLYIGFEKVLYLGKEWKWCSHHVAEYGGISINYFTMEQLYELFKNK